MKSSRLFKPLQIERSLLSLYCKNQDKHSSHVRSTGQRYRSHLDFLNLYKLRGVYYLCTVKTKINTPLMYEVLDKDTIKSEILPYLSVAKRGYVTKSDLVEVIQCILYKLKTGCQWHMLPVSAIFTGRVLSYKSVYAHFRKWSRNGEWKKVWGMILSHHRSFLDMSSVDLDGSHTTTLRGGECCGYQGRKKRTTTNAIYVTDRQGIPLAMSTPVSGSHNDLHNISLVLQDLFAGIKDSGLSV